MPIPAHKLAGLCHETLENAYIQRSWCIEDGLATTVFNMRPRGIGPWREVMHFDPWFPFEALLVVDGQEMAISRFEIQKEMANLQGVFALQDVARLQTDLGERLDFDLVALPGLPQIALTLHCELVRNQPLLRTWLTIRNQDTVPHVVERVTLEAIYHARRNRELNYLFSRQDVDIVADPRFISYFLAQTQTPNVKPLAPNETTESFALMTGVCPPDARWRTAINHDLIHTFAPQTRRPLIHQQFQGWQDTADLRQSIDEAAEIRVELLFLQYNDGLSYGDLNLNAKLFPGGEDDLRLLCEYAKKRGVRIGCYVGVCMADYDSKVVQAHPDWQFLGDNGTRYNPYGAGNMCPSSPWGTHLRQKLERFAELGISAFQTDGPPYAQICHEVAHGHPSPKTAKLDNWNWERGFNRYWTAQDVVIQSPTEYPVLFDGVSQLCGGYTEDEQETLAGQEQITNFRAGLLSAMETLPASCQWGFLLVGKLHGSRPAMVSDIEAESALYEQALAGHLGYGLTGCLNTKNLFTGPRSKAIALRWIGFYKRYRALLTDRTLLLKLPDGQGLDAVVHVTDSDDSQTCAVVVVFNPTDQPRQGVFCIPLEFAGWVPGKTAQLRRNGEGDPLLAEVDDQGQAIVRVAVAPQSVDWWEFAWA